MVVKRTVNAVVEAGETLIRQLVEGHSTAS